MSVWGWKESEIMRDFWVQRNLQFKSRKKSTNKMEINFAINLVLFQSSCLLENRIQSFVRNLRKIKIFDTINIDFPPRSNLPPLVLWVFREFEEGHYFDYHHNRRCSLCAYKFASNYAYIYFSIQMSWTSSKRGYSNEKKLLIHILK